MLAPGDRRLYTSCFSTPEGYVFDYGVGTTFTLDFRSFLFVPVALASAQLEEPADALRDPVGLLEAIHRVGDRLTVFSHDGHSDAPEVRHPLLSLLESSFVPARARGDGAIFHPKLWLLRFRGQSEERPLLRAVILSRNITASRCWDTLVCLEGTPNPKQKVPESRELAKLVRALPGLTTSERPSPERLAWLETLAAEAERTPFYAPEPFDTSTLANFVALGTGDGAKWEPDGGERLLGISPFLGERALRALARLADKCELISRDETLDRMPRAALEGWHCFSLHDGAGGEADPGEGSDTADSVPFGLHAKALVVEQGKRTMWWLGSGNLSDAVLNGTNVELLVRLEGATKRVGIDRFLESGFDALRRPYDTAGECAPDTPAEAAERLAEQARHAIVRADLGGACRDAGDGSWTLTLSGDVEVPGGALIEVRPMTLPVGHARRWAGEALEFRGVAIESLTAFFAFRIETRVADSAVTITFSRKLPVSGFPEERLRRVVQSVITDRSTFLTYLDRVLGGIDGPIGSLSSAKVMAGRSAGAGNAVQSEAVVLESIVRALRRDPERLAAIDHTIERLRSDTDGSERAIVPPDFLELWTLVRTTVPASQKGGDG